ncbi:MAG: hypothetical protein RJQ14_04475, partial [Marinoscillum sp.]
MYLKLSEAAERFQEGKASLWKMPDLQLALNWREENRPTLVWGQRYNPAFERTMVFLETSEKAYVTEQRNKELLQKRQVKRMRMSAIFLGGAALVCLFFVVYANIKADDAKKQEAAALVAQKQAAENAEKAEKFAEEATNEAAKARQEATRADQKAAEALEAQKNADIQRLAALAQKAEADKQKLAAQEAQKDADKNAALARAETEKAQLAQKAADEARVRAEKLRMQSVAQSMAIKARKIPDRELKAVVAKQAFDFYDEFGDPTRPYNADIYAGIYSGLEGVLGTTRIDDNGEPVYINNGDSVLNQYHGHLAVRNEYGEKIVAVRSVVFSQDGNRMYSAGSDGRLLMWDMTNNRRSFVEIYRKSQVNRVVNLSDNERYLALGTEDNHIIVVDLQNTNAEPIQIEGHVGGTVFDLVFLSDNNRFISTGADSRILFHSLSSKKTVEIAHTSDRAKSLALSPDNKTLAAGTGEGEVVIIDLEDAEYSSRNIYRKSNSPVHALHFNHSGDKLAFGDEHGDVYIWDLVAKKKFGPTLTGFESAISDLEFAPNDNLLVATSKDKTARMWDLNNIYDLPT